MPITGDEDDNETDTIYSNVINEDNVKEFSDIEFKICTWDNKMLNYSAPAYYTGSDYKFIDTLTNSALNLTERSENQLINRIVNQYTDPAIKLELNLGTDIKPYTLITEPVLGKTMIVNSISYDYRYDKATVNVVEKK